MTHICLGKKNLKIFAVISALIFNAGIVLGADKGDAREKNGFNSIRADCFTIYYEPEVDLKTIYRRITQKRFYAGRATELENPSTFPEKIVYRMSVLYDRVAEILGMYQYGISFFVIIYKRQEDLYDKFTELTGKREEPRAFYFHKDKAIYSSEYDVSDSVIAHELAHCIIKHYFMVATPRKLEEILAIYVDEHLGEDSNAFPSLLNKGKLVKD